MSVKVGNVMRGLLVFVSNTQEPGKTVEGRKIEQNLMSFHTHYIYTLLVIIMTEVVGEWGLCWSRSCYCVIINT